VQRSGLILSDNNYKVPMSVFIASFPLDLVCSNLLSSHVVYYEDLQ